MQEGTKREEETKGSSRAGSEGDADVRKQILKELGVPAAQAESQDTRALDLYLQIRLEQERKQIELLREANLGRLNTIIDKCIQCDKFTQESLGKILELVDRPLPSSQQELQKQYWQQQQLQQQQQQQQQQKQQRSAQPTVVLSPEPKKRKLASPMVSPKGHRRFISEIPSLGSRELPMAQSPYYGVPATGGPTPWVGQQYNQQQFEYKGPIPAGLGGSARSREGISTPMTMENQPQTAAMPQQVVPGPYSAGQFVQGPGGYLLPTAQGGRPPVIMMQAETPQRVASGYLQPPQQIAPSYGVKQETPQMRRYQGHRRSQSATVPAASNVNSIRSPVRELHATPQKPVNFLIHTPKHPPPN
ncbi:uncharacterized protein ZBAI_03049 [Zygosaccharomyces bailii ISA1307]|nr:uncharacterized protein ZBAI_03049 [Zygosaccharomyces bailii ISA1307]